MKKISLLFTFVLLCSSLMAQFKTKKNSNPTGFNPTSPVLKPANLNFDKPTTDEDVMHLGPIAEFEDRWEKSQKLRPQSIDANGQARMIMAGSNFGFNSRNGLESQIFALIKEAKPYLNINNPQVEFKIKSSELDELGMEHLRLTQMYNGVEIYGGELIVHTKDSKIESINGVSYPTPKLSNVQPAIDINTLKGIVKQDQATEEKEFNELQSKLVLQRWKDQLVIFHVDKKESQERLAYHVIYYPNVIDRWEYIVDALDGTIIQKFKSTCDFNVNHHHGASCTHNHTSKEISKPNKVMDGPVTATAQDLKNISRTINTWEVGSDYVMIDASRSMYNSFQSNMPNDPVGVIWTVDAGNTSPQSGNFGFNHVVSGNNSWSGEKNGVSAHFNGGEAYEYFKNVHGRESINGQGGNIISIINVSDGSGGDMDNAFWNGQAMFYGNGDFAFTAPLAKSLDVAAHEMSHGVVQASANLEYYGESGAMNESFADIFGAMVDGDWLIGEDIVNTSIFTGGALRNMQDPHNGQSTNNFQNGWQPKRVSEQYNGSEDNAGVHWNSGIPNHAYYLIAEEITPTKAERIFYRALTQYLTKSSQFVDLRIAVEKSASDLYGTTELNACKEAFDIVEIAGGQGGDYQNDQNSNPGDDFILFAGQNLDRIGVLNNTGGVIADPISNKNPISRPSITDNGESIYFIADDKMIHRINIQWPEGNVSEEVVQTQAIWRNVVVSKDGRRFAALTEDYDNKLLVYDFVVGDWNEYELFNPTTGTGGVTTGDVLYADAMEFDLSGQSIIYDAINRISSQGGADDIEYWDVSFINVWNNSSDTWSLGQTSKLFSQLPDGVSVGNPSFAKNSPYIIAIDVLDNGDNFVVGVNIETGDIGTYYENQGLGYPSFSRTDEQLLFDAPWSNGNDIGILDVANDKISAVAGTEFLFFEEGRWGVWFANGERDLTSTAELDLTHGSLSVYPNPTDGQLDLVINTEDNSDLTLRIIDQNARVVTTKNMRTIRGENKCQLDISNQPNGVYHLQIIDEEKMYSTKVVKIKRD